VGHRGLSAVGIGEVPVGVLPDLVRRNRGDEDAETLQCREILGADAANVLEHPPPTGERMDPIDVRENRQDLRELVADDCVHAKVVTSGERHVGTILVRCTSGLDEAVQPVSGRALRVSLATAGSSP
jgi:hypothetical protein